jgi:putative restriction endonuclease
MSQTKKRNWLHAAGVLWDVLARTAMESRTMTYEEAAPHIDTNPLSVRLALAPIQDYCLSEKLPPLTSIVVQKATRLPGEGFIAWDIDALHEAHAKVFAENWALRRNPYKNLGVDDDFGSLARAIITDPNESEAIYAKVPVRGIAQVIFRKALLEAYEGQCAICGLSYECALDAAHIVPWSNASQSQRLDPRNGLLLCATHHRLFDEHVLTISQSLRVVHFDPQEERGPYTDADRRVAPHMHGRMIFVPSNSSLRPSPSLLAQRHRDNGWLNLENLNLM